MSNDEYSDIENDIDERQQYINESTSSIGAQKIVSAWRPQDADKEFIKQNIRRRVRNAAVADNAVFIPAKPKPTIQDKEQKKVAVYARVSTKSTEQVSSIENQTKYYTEKIEKNPNWEMQEIYSDEGKSGTSMRKRIEFKRMLKDAAEKKIDLILCASVSRFARNVADCIEQVRTLRTMPKPVGVYFETEDIYSLDPDSNQLLTIHAMLADWESANKSRRMILSYDQRICTGQYPVSDLLGYRHTQEGDLVIQEDEAITVRFIFLAYIYGYSCEEIAKILTARRRPTLKGRTDWNASMVRSIMNNERRWGDLNARKTIVIDYVKGKTVKNNQIRDAAFVAGHHTGIVTPEIAKAAQMVTASSRSHEGGISDIIVIEEGALKGFVSICPGWGGIDADTFYKVSKSVYSDDEFRQLEHEDRILSGKEHSNVYSIEFTGYQVPYGVFFINKNTPTLTISQKSIKFNRKCHEKLSNCKYIEILYHPILKSIIVRPSNENSPSAFCWDDNDKMILNIPSNALSNAIYENMNWIREYRFKFRGITKERGNVKVMMFFLDEPQILVGKGVKKSTKSDFTDMPVKYIPYKNDEGSVEQKLDERKSFCAYPDEWSINDNIGISYSLRNKRDNLANSLTEADLSISGKVVDNPMIGKIPTREQLVEELDKLLMSM